MYSDSSMWNTIYIGLWCARFLINSRLNHRSNEIYCLIAIARVHTIIVCALFCVSYVCVCVGVANDINACVCVYDMCVFEYRDTNTRSSPVYYICQKKTIRLSSVVHIASQISRVEILHFDYLSPIVTDHGYSVVRSLYYCTCISRTCQVSAYDV